MADQAPVQGAFMIMKEKAGNMSLSLDDDDDDQDHEPYHHELKMAGIILTEKSATPQLRRAAMAVIGHVSYCGGQDVVATAVKYLPYLGSAFTLPENSTYIVPALKAISEMSVRSKAVREFFVAHPTVLTAIVNIIAGSDVSASRWACYVLTRLIVTHNKLQNMVRNVPKITEILYNAATCQPTWVGWGDNLAENLLIMLKFVDAQNKK